MTVNLKRVSRKRDYYQEGPDWVRKVWTTPNAFDHFCKSRREPLAAAGAIHKLGRDWFVDTELFPIAAENLYSGQPAHAAVASLDSASVQ